ncbi:MAG: hypothetical protein JSS66_00095 [Armatimonadetes bacterium]|nr:hypothetical protein [Armatimonadota bacterium]
MSLERLKKNLGRRASAKSNPLGKMTDFGFRVITVQVAGVSYTYVPGRGFHANGVLIPDDKVPETVVAAFQKLLPKDLKADPEIVDAITRMIDGQDTDDAKLIRAWLTGKEDDQGTSANT